MAANSPWGARRTRQNRFQEKQEALFDTAAALFRERGYQGASLDELAERLSITKPTLYYYVANKESLLLQILLRAQDEALEFIKDLSQGPGSACDRLRSIMLRYAILMTSDYGACMSMVRAAELDADGRAQLDQRMSAATRILKKLFAEGVRDGTLKAVDPVILQPTLFGALNWNAFWYQAGGRLRPARLAEAQVDLLLDGVRKHGGQGI